MRRRAWLLAVALVLAADAWILASAWHDGSGEPTSELILTEREAPVAGIAGPEWENSGLSLQIAWQGRWGTEGSETELDSAKLAELGFDVSVPVTDARARRHYSTMLSRDVFVALENDGPSWPAWQERQLARAAAAADAMRTRGMAETDVARHLAARERQIRDGSRLILIDTGLDPAALRARHPDATRVLVVPAVADVAFDHEEVKGRISHVRADVVNVPRRLAGPLRDLRNGPPSPWSVPPLLAKWDAVTAPRYAVMIRWGRDGVPRLVEVLPAQGPR